MNYKNLDSLRASLLAAYEKTLDLDLTQGTPERDIFVEAPIAGQLLDLWNALVYLYKLQAPFLYATELLEEDLATFCNNYGVGQLPATYSKGEVTFFANTEPTSDIQIDTSVTVTDGTNNYRVTGYYTIPVSRASDYYNAVTKRWEITCPVIATVAGSSGSTGAGKVTKLVNSVKGIDGCINNTAITGGEDAGGILERVDLVKQKFKGRNLNTLEGIRLYVNKFATNVNIVGSNSPLMVRSEGLGGTIDIYIRGSSYEGASDSVTITSSGLLGLVDDVSYTSTGIVLQYQPVYSVALVSKNGSYLPTNYYQLVKDTGILRKSTRSLDRVELTSTGIAAGAAFAPGDTVQVRYNYNQLLHQIESDLNSIYNLYDNRDYLLREQEEVIIDVYLKIKLYSGYSLDAVRTTASLSLATYADEFTTGNVELIDVLALVKAINGVDNIDVTTAKLTPRDGRSTTTAGDVPIGENEFPEFGTLTFVEWTA